MTDGQLYQRFESGMHQEQQQCVRTGTFRGLITIVGVHVLTVKSDRSCQNKMHNFATYAALAFLGVVFAEGLAHILFSEYLQRRGSVMEEHIVLGPLLFVISENLTELIRAVVVFGVPFSLVLGGFIAVKERFARASLGVCLLALWLGAGIFVYMAYAA